MIVIYGKPACAFCDAAKNLLNSKGIPYEYRQLGADFTVEELKEIAPRASSFPQVFVDGQNIGGFEQLRVKVGLIEGFGSKPDVLLG